MILILLAGLGAGVYLTTRGNPLKLFSKASSESVTIDFQSDKAQIKAGNDFEFSIYIKPGQAEVIGADISLDYGDALSGGGHVDLDPVFTDMQSEKCGANCVRTIILNTNKTKVRSGMLIAYRMRFPTTNPGSGAIKITKAAIVTTKGVVDQANINKEAVLTYTILPASTPPPAITPTPIATTAPSPTSTPPVRIPSPSPVSTGVTTTISAYPNQTAGNPVTFKATVSTSGTLSQATIWLAKGDKSSGARIEASDVEVKDASGNKVAFDANNFNCSDKTQNCIWYRIGKTTTVGEFSGTVTFLKPGSYVAIASAEDTEKGPDGNIVACSANPYVAPFTAWGKTYSSCLDPQSSIPDVAYINVSSP